MIDAGADEHYIIFGVYNICGREHHHAEHAVVIYPGRAPPASGQEASTNPILTLNDRRRRRRISNLEIKLKSNGPQQKTPSQSNCCNLYLKFPAKKQEKDCTVTIYIVSPIAEKVIV